MALDLAALTSIVRPRESRRNFRSVLNLVPNNQGNPAIGWIVRLLRQPQPLIREAPHLRNLAWLDSRGLHHPPSFVGPFCRQVPVIVPRDPRNRVWSRCAPQSKVVRKFAKLYRQHLEQINECGRRLGASQFKKRALRRLHQLNAESLLRNRDLNLALQLVLRVKVVDRTKKILFQLLPCLPSSGPRIRRCHSCWFRPSFALPLGSLK
jgi:hypothetical protein